MAKEPIVQISAPDKAVVENLGSNLTKAMMFVMGSSFIISLILGATLQPLLGSIEILQVMSFMMTINVASPANVNIFFRIFDHSGLLETLLILDLILLRIILENGINKLFIKNSHNMGI